MPMDLPRKLDIQDTDFIFNFYHVSCIHSKITVLSIILVGSYMSEW